MAAQIGYFAYGTLQKGFPNWPDLADQLGEPVGRFRTVEPHALVVPIQPGCGNPGCGMLHRMAALVPGVPGFRVDGDLFMIDRCALAAVDRLEAYDDRREPPGLYVRTSIEIASIADDQVRAAITYRVRDPTAWLALVTRRAAELHERYEHHLAHATLKQCCIRNPRHHGPHDVLDPLAPSA